MAKGTFVVSRDEENPRDIHFRVRSGAEVPPEQAELRDQVDRTLTTLRLLYSEENDDRFEIYFRQLLSLAQLGLVGKDAQPEVARRTLSTLRDDITAQEAGRVKNRYMRTLGLNASLLGSPAVLASGCLYFFLPNLQIIAGLLLLWAGCMGGGWLSFGARKTVMRFDDLHILEEDRVEPRLRLVFTGLLGLTFGLMFSLRAIDIAIGDIQLSSLNEDPRVAILVGLLLGFSEKALPTALTTRAATILR